MGQEDVEMKISSAVTNRTNCSIEKQEIVACAKNCARPMKIIRVQMFRYDINISNVCNTQNNDSEYRWTRATLGQTCGQTSNKNPTISYNCVHYYERIPFIRSSVRQPKIHTHTDTHKAYEYIKCHCTVYRVECGLVSFSFTFVRKKWPNGKKLRPRIIKALIY